MALLVAVALRRDDPVVGYDLGSALAAIGGELPTTLPAAILVALVSVVDVLAGAILLRALAGRPYRSWSEAALAGFAGAVLLDCLLVFALGGASAFRPLVVGAVLLIVLVLGGRWCRPLVAPGPRPDVWPGWSRPRPGAIVRGLLVVLVWCGPLLVALASPVVPAADVLPNHVAPAEHLRVFGSIASLATYPSPIYGPSRLFLGYSDLMASLATLTGLPAALTVAAWTGPLLALTALSMRRLAATFFGRRAGFWVLLVFPLSFTFVRLPDVRDSVVALPLAALSLSLLARRSGGDRGLTSGARPDWLLAVALAATILVHPLVGALTLGSVGLMTMADPAGLARRTIPAMVAAAIACLPQLAVMTGLAPAPWLGMLAFAVAGLTLAVLGSVMDRTDGLGLERISTRSATWAVLIAAGAGLAVVGVLAPGAIGQAGGSFNGAFRALFGLALLAALGLAPTARGGRRQLLACVAAGLAGLVVVGLIPSGSLLAQSLQYEVPKAVGYWLPWVCVAAAAGLVAAVARWPGPAGVRLLVLGAILAIVLIPVGPPLPDSAQASHPVADSLAQDLRTAEQGYWQGYPDVRLVVDPAGDDVLDFLRSEIGAGQIAAETQLLHVAAELPGIGQPADRRVHRDRGDDGLGRRDDQHLHGRRPDPPAQRPAIRAPGRVRLRRPRTEGTSGRRPGRHPRGRLPFRVRQFHCRGLHGPAVALAVVQPQGRSGCLPPVPQPSRSSRAGRSRGRWPSMSSATSAQPAATRPSTTSLPPAITRWSAWPFRSTATSRPSGWPSDLPTAVSRAMWPARPGLTR